MKASTAATAVLLLIWMTTTCNVNSVMSSYPLSAYETSDSFRAQPTASRRIFGPLDLLPLFARIRGALREGRREKEEPYSLFRFPRLFAPPTRVKSTEEEIAEYVRDYIRAAVRDRQRQRENRNLREGRRALDMLKKQTSRV